MSLRTKCTPELTKEICKVLAAGNYIEVACKYVGMGISTFYQWRNRGEAELERVAENPRARIRKSEKPYVEFAEATKKAHAAAEVHSVVRIREAAKDDWRAASWYLQYGQRERWGKKTVEVTGKDGGPIEIKEDPEARRERIAELIRMMESADDK